MCQEEYTTNKREFKQLTYKERIKIETQKSAEFHESCKGDNTNNSEKVIELANLFVGSRVSNCAEDLVSLGKPAVFNISANLENNNVHFKGIPITSSKTLVRELSRCSGVSVKRDSNDMLLKDDELASSYENGFCLVFRLGVDNYHRYCYLDDGTKLSNKFIKGRLHTVRPIALSKFPVFCENAREYTVLQTKNFSDVIQVEVGALLVGKIKNFHNEYTFRRGEEKGCFLYGGSTIILLFKEGTIELRDELFTSSNDGEETPVKMGEVIGRTRER